LLGVGGELGQLGEPAFGAAGLAGAEAGFQLGAGAAELVGGRLLARLFGPHGSHARQGESVGKIPRQPRLRNRPAVASGNLRRSSTGWMGTRSPDRERLCRKYPTTSTPCWRRPAGETRLP